MVYPDGRVWSKRHVKRGKFLEPMIASGYKTVRLINNRGWRNHSVHRLVARAFIGESSLEVDHIDRNRFNNHVSNLRYVTRSENCLNKPKPTTRRFVYPRSNGTYTSNISVKGKSHYVGCFKNEEEAYSAAHAEYTKIFGIEPWSENA